MMIRELRTLCGLEEGVQQIDWSKSSMGAADVALLAAEVKAGHAAVTLNEITTSIGLTGDMRHNGAAVECTRNTRTKWRACPGAALVAHNELQMNVRMTVEISMRIALLAVHLRTVRSLGRTPSSLSAQHHGTVQTPRWREALDCVR
eukprot:COSAG02_NODE_16403_length_1086_cov_2.591692_2_plen_147_part_00